MLETTLRNAKDQIQKNLWENKNVSYYSDKNHRLHPYKEALKIAILYGLLGIVWIAFPEEWIGTLFNDTIILRQINIYKGWAFVGLSVVLIFVFVLQRLLLYESAAKNLELNLNKQIEIEKELHRMAYFDVLTQLPNRALFEMRCKNQINVGNNQPFAIVCMDVDNFKNINDTLGHAAGDVFLKNLSELLHTYIGPNAFVARVGGDEFAIIMEDIKNKADASDRVQYLLNNLRRPWVFGGQSFPISVSMGIVLYPEHGEDLNLLLRNADIAMYAVKRNMKNNYQFYSEELNEKNNKQIKMTNELNNAITNQEFVLLYQPIVDMNIGKLSGVEALIRWIHPEQGVISPMEFIPLAEEIGLIEDIEKWVIKTAFLQKKAWEDQGKESAHLMMSINISGKSFMKYGFVNEIRNLLMETKINSNEIQFEITETFFIENLSLSEKIINNLSNMGILIALDDFGTGYSSLTYLKKLPIDVVKLDKDFVKGIVNKGEDSVIVESVIKLTHDLGLTIIAEGIETNAQLSKLKSYDCDYGQGYLFDKPVSSTKIEELIKIEGIRKASTPFYISSETALERFPCNV